jgi:type 1 glutamine amidotransferase
VDFRVHVEDPKHPITQGLSDFAIKDETYLGHGLRPGMHVLLTTDEKTNSRAVAWVHKFRNAPVFYFQLGHDAKAYGQPEFATILGRGIRWTAGRLPAR